MAKSRDRSSLYRLIEAGQLAHRKLIAPLRDLGLQQGDDVILLILADGAEVATANLATRAGVPGEALAPHLRRLVEGGLIARTEAPERYMLSAAGRRVEAILARHWTELEAAVHGDLRKGQRKALARRLGAIADRLR